MKKKDLLKLFYFTNGREKELKIKKRDFLCKSTSFWLLGTTITRVWFYHKIMRNRTKGG